MLTRRTLLRSALAAGAAALPIASRLGAQPRRLPLGLQLYSVKDMLARDYVGTLKQVAALGYREVEAAGFFDRTPAQVRQAMQAAGLLCVSAHYQAPGLFVEIDRIVDFAHAAGLRYVVCSLPAIRRPERLPDRTYDTVSRSYLMEDWHYNAEQFNRIGATLHKAGLRLAYHNHTIDFVPLDGVVPFDVLVRETDPELVCFELDCGWAAVAGADPAEVLQQHGARIQMLHLKDFRSFTVRGSDHDAVATELGRGRLDNVRTLRAARSAALQHVFIEQEGFDVPWLQSLREDADWLRGHEALLGAADAAQSETTRRTHTPEAPGA